MKKTEYDELIKRVNNIKTTDTSNLAQKDYYNTKTSEIEKKILDQNHDEYTNIQEFNKLTSDNFADFVKHILTISEKKML